MEKLRDLAFTFTCIMTGSTIMAAIFISIFYPEDATIHINILWQIIITSAICTLASLLYPERKLTKVQLYTLNIIHYVYVLFVVIGGGLYFEWFYIYQYKMLIAMFGSVSFVFVVIMYITYRKSKSDSEIMNQKLQEYQKNKH